MDHFALKAMIWIGPFLVLGSLHLRCQAHYFRAYNARFPERQLPRFIGSRGRTEWARMRIYRRALATARRDPALKILRRRVQLCSVLLTIWLVLGPIIFALVG